MIKTVKKAEIQCCSELFISGGYEFREKSKTIDLARRHQVWCIFMQRKMFDIYRMGNAKCKIFQKSIVFLY